MKAPRKHGLMARISTRAKVITLLLLFVFCALALVMSFGAGFAMSAVMTEAGAQDRCNTAGGVWDEAIDLCTLTTVQAAQVFAPIGGGDAYACGDGSTFIVDTSLADRRIFQRGGTTLTRDLLQSSTSVGIYSDGEVTIAFDGLDALYTDGQNGSQVLCAMQDSEISAE